MKVPWEWKCFIRNDLFFKTLLPLAPYLKVVFDVGKEAVLVFLHIEL